jgi:hypothetical protein
MLLRNRESKASRGMAYVEFSCEVHLKKYFFGIACGKSKVSTAYSLYIYRINSTHRSLYRERSMNPDIIV